MLQREVPAWAVRAAEEARAPSNSDQAAALLFRFLLSVFFGEAVDVVTLVLDGNSHLNSDLAFLRSAPLYPCKRETSLFLFSLFHGRFS